MVAAIGCAFEGFPFFGRKDFLQSEVELLLIRLGDALNPSIERGIVLRGVWGVLVIGINRQDVLSFLQILSLFFIEDDGSVLRLIQPPDVGVNLVAVQINMKPLSCQNRDAVGIVVEDRALVGTNSSAVKVEKQARGC